jgi:hypothetical protein
MSKKLLSFLCLIFIFSACENIERPKNISGEEAVKPSYSTLNFTDKELPALLSLCQSFPNLILNGSVQHDFDYKKNVCDQQNETYRQGQKVDLNGLLPVYVANNRSLFYFPEVRFDRAEQGHALSVYCQKLALGVTDRIIPPEDNKPGFKHTLEVIVNHSQTDFIRNTPGCYDASMFGASATNELVCLRIWKDQVDAKGVLVQSINYETITFVASDDTLAVHSGYTVHRKKYDYLQCTDKTKALVYEATRIK